MLNKYTNTLFSGIKINKKSLFKNIKMSENISKYDKCDFESVIINGEEFEIERKNPTTPDVLTLNKILKKIEMYT